MSVKLEYEKQRSGADMQYRFRITLNPLNTSSSYYGYWIKCDISLDNVAKQTGLMLKDVTPYNWMTGIVTTTGWYTVSNKTSGTTGSTFKVYGQSGRNYTYGFTLAIDPAASIISASNGTLGSPLAITITRYNSSYTHKLYYYCGSIQYQNIATGFGTSYSWTSPISLAAQNTTGSSVSVTLVCETFSGSTYMGGNTTTITMAIPASVAPSVSFSSITDPEGYYSTYGCYLQDLSKLQIALSASGAQGSTVTAYNISVGSLWTYSTNSVTTPILPNAGTLSLTAKVTDSRGRTTTSSPTNITVAAYSRPSITTITVKRCTATGVDKNDGAYAKVTFSASITPIDNQNSAAYTVKYREQGTSAWTDVVVSSAAGSYSPTDVSMIFAANVNKAFEVYLEAEDDIATASSTTQIVPIAFMLAQATADGTGLAIGELATESDKFNVNLDTFFKRNLYLNGSPIADFIVEQGTSGVWTSS